MCLDRFRGLFLCFEGFTVIYMRLEAFRGIQMGFRGV